MTECSHKGEGKKCPISKTPCIGECIYASILDDINMGIIGMDIVKREVFFQNKLAINIFKGTISPKDFEALSSLLCVCDPKTSDAVQDQKTVAYGNRFIGCTIYRISDRYLWIYVVDVTEKMRLDSIAEAVNMMNNLGYIFSGIRHELGNPINSIKTTMTVCKNKLDSYSKENIREYIDRVLYDINRVEILLRDLKNFSMYENPQLAEVEIADFMKNLMSIIERDFRERKIEIRTSIKPGADRGYFDSRALQHVMLNVLTNAADSLKDRPSPEINLGIFRKNDRIIIKVRDNGCGIPADQKRHLFKPFFTTKSHGTGLGLTITRKMLFKMGGDVEIDSVEDVGTTVMINLPASA